MRTFIFLTGILLSSLFSSAQANWVGNYSVLFEAKKYKHSRTEIRIWAVKDSGIVTYKWSLNAYLKDKWVWENSGDAKQIGENKVELFVTAHKNAALKDEEKQLAKLIKKNPVFTIDKRGSSYFLECECRSEKEKDVMQLVKK